MFTPRAIIKQQGKPDGVCPWSNGSYDDSSAPGTDRNRLNPARIHGATIAIDSLSQSLTGSLKPNKAPFG